MNEKITRMIMMMVGIFLIGLAVALLRISSFGTDPFTSMNLGVSGFLGMQFGVYQLIVNIILFVIVWKYARQTIGIGTIINMVMVGFIADYFVYMSSLIIGGDLTMFVRVVIMLLAVLIIGIAVSLYMTANLGIAPYDAFAIVIQKVTNNRIPFSWARVMTDVTCVLIGFSFGTIVGISTVITAFFTGHLVQFFNTNVSERLLKGKLIPKTVV